MSCSPSTTAARPTPFGRCVLCGSLLPPPSTADHQCPPGWTFPYQGTNTR